MTVTGAGSTWTNTGALTIGGGSGNGTLNVLSGGSVSNTIGYIGYGPGSTNTVTVDGAGGLSTSTNSGILYVGYGNGGRCTATLNITNGGSVSAGSATYVGYGTGISRQLLTLALPTAER